MGKVMCFYIPVIIYFVLLYIPIDNNLERITWHFADNIFKCIFSIENFCILIQIKVFPSDANDRKHGHFR